MKLPVVSVIIPTYNRALWLRECLEAVFAQHFQNFEVIVVDDGSRDETRSVLAGYLDKLILISQENRGVSAARNRGIAMAGGEYIAFCDSDDLWLPDKLSTQISFFQNYPQKIACYTDEIWVRNGVRVNPCKHHRKSSGWIFDRALELCIVSPSSVVMHRKFFEKVGNFDESLPACEDYDLWLRASVHFPFQFIEKSLIIKRGGHPDQLSKKYWGMDRFRIQAILKILQQPISSEQRQKAIQMLRKKCTIVANGAQKRGNTTMAIKYRRLLEEW